MRPGVAWGAVSIHELRTCLRMREQGKGRAGCRGMYTSWMRRRRLRASEPSHLNSSTADASTLSRACPSTYACGHPRAPRAHDPDGCLRPKIRMLTSIACPAPAPWNGIIACAWGAIPDSPVSSDRSRHHRRKPGCHETHWQHADNRSGVLSCSQAAHRATSCAAHQTHEVRGGQHHQGPQMWKQLRDTACATAALRSELDTHRVSEKDYWTGREGSQRDARRDRPAAVRLCALCRGSEQRPRRSRIEPYQNPRVRHRRQKSVRVA